MSYRLEVRICLALAAAVAGVFWRTTGHGFIDFDDLGYVTANVFVRQGLTGESVRWAFANTGHYYWSPLTYLSHMLDVEWFGMDAGRHHRTNLILHALNAVLAFVALRAATGSRWRSAAAAALFALHPLRVESVGWVAERKDLLCGFFWLSTVIAWIRYRRCAFPVIALFILGAMSKPMIVMLPFVLILLDYWPGRRGDLAALVKEKLPLWLVAAASGVLAFVGQRANHAVASLSDVPPLARLENYALSMTLYLRDLVWPESLGIMYPLLPRAVPAAPAAACAAALAALTWLAFRHRARAPYVWFGWLWYLGTILPVSGLIQVGRQARADRFTYLPSIGLAVAVVWGAAELLKKRRAAGAVLALAILAASGVLSWRQLEHWRSSATVFGHTLSVISGATPHSLGTTGLPPDFVERYRGTEFWPPLFSFWLQLIAGDFEAEGMKEQALTAYTDAVRVKPDFAEGHFGRGVLLSGMGRAGEAWAALETALRLGPPPKLGARVRFELGIIRQREGQARMAVEQFTLALSLDPDLTEARKLLALSLDEMGETAEAARELERVVNERPDDNEAREKLRVMRQRVGRP